MALLAAVIVAVVLAACTNESGRAPNPTHYAWPDEFAYRVQNVGEAVRDTTVVVRYEEAKLLRFAIRYERFVVWHDSISRTTTAPGAAPTDVRLNPEDTLRYFVGLSRLGAFLNLQPACDPTVPACGDAFPSALPLELRHLIPKLPVWWPPKGHEWVDTLRFDDLPRPGAARGEVVTTYRDLRDTVVAGHPCWMVSWRSRTEAARPGAGGAMVPDPPTVEQGDVLVDKQTLMPLFAGWYGAAAAPPALRAAGVTASAHQGRAWLVGSVYDSLRVVP